MQELTETSKQEVAVAQDLGSWGEEQISSQDIIIPKILPQQYMSDKVKSGESLYGELRDTLENKLMADANGTMEFVPFYVRRQFLEFAIKVAPSGKRKREYIQAVDIVSNPRDPGYNDNLPRISTDGLLERDRELQFFVLIPSEIADGSALPYILSFKRTSMRGGKQLNTQMYVKNRAAKKTPASVVMGLSLESVQNDDGEFCVQLVKPVRETTDIELQEAFKWLQVVQAGNVKVDAGSDEVPF